MTKREIGRRGFLAGTAGGLVAGAAGGLAKPAIAQERIEWNMVMPWPMNAPGVGVNAGRFAEMVTAMSGGRLVIKLFGAGELVPPFEVLDAVQNDVAQVGHASPYYWQGKAPSLNYFTTVPFGLTAWELAGWLYFGEGQALWEEVYAPFGIQPFFAGSSGVQAGGWFRREVNTVDDLKGLKMRIAGLGGEVMRRLGVAVVLTPPGEIFPALQSGTVDAAEWVGPWNDLAFGLYKAAPYYYMPAFHEPGPSLEIIVNQARYRALPDDLQAIIAHAAQATSMVSIADFAFHNVVSLQPLLDKGVELRTFSDEIVEALGEATKEVLGEMAERDPLTRRVHDSFTAFNQQAARYAKWAELPNLMMRQKVLGV
ncbi:TRAP transporter substrate-binding protein [Roseospirillum parvum]|uniref:TRAP-type mannitol/chloroaromatic compound transport system, substrate-binding protein n=1 Tax=Roseospirillum parvum TaxID=83401 RepID=A0A1G7UL91_9PROT|nr:TRAP transporter substrate-binding protein [Roseospirillum parvum]SDG48263.1 TRAP-type mannitol/chloroaromatic compound transport system, substrate-binding protein [Roseospirillum parvum]